MMKKHAIMAMLFFLLIGYVSSALAWEDREDTFFETPVECVENFVDCLKRGDIEGLVAGFALDTTAEILDASAQAMRAGTETTLGDGYETLSKKMMVSDRLNRIRKMIQSLLIPEDWSIKEKVLSCDLLYISDEDGTFYYYDEGEIVQTDITIDTYCARMKKENLSKIEAAFIYKINYGEEMSKGLERNFERIRTMDFSGHVDDQMFVLLAVRYDGQLSAIGFTLYHFSDRGWAIKAYVVAWYLRQDAFSPLDYLTLGAELGADVIPFDNSDTELILLEDVYEYDKVFTESMI